MVLGFAMVLLVAAVGWLAWTVADLRGQMSSPLEVVEVQEAEEEAPALPDPLRSEPVPGADTKKETELGPSLKQKPKPAKAAMPQGFRRTTAAEMGIEGLPPDMEMVVAMDGMGEEPVASQMGDASGPISGGEYADDPEMQEEWRNRHSRERFDRRLEELFPGVRATKLSEQEVKNFQTSLRVQFRAEAAILHTLMHYLSQDEVRSVLPVVAGAIEAKWQNIESRGGPQNADPQAFEEADLMVAGRLAEILPPGVMDGYHRSIESGEAFVNTPTEGELQEIGWVVKSLLTSGLRNTMDKVEEMKSEASLPPPPPGVAVDDPDFQEAQRRRRRSYKSFPKPTGVQPARPPPAPKTPDLLP